MKRKILSVLAIIVALSAILMMASCSSSTTASTESAAPAESSTAETSTESSAASGLSANASLKMATGGTTGTYYAFGGIVSGALEANVSGLTCTVHDSGASKSNVFELIDGDADLAFVQNDVTYYAITGTDLFADQGAQTGFSVLAGMYPEVVQIVASADITDISQLKGKRVSVGDAGSGTEFNARQILAAYDITFDDIDVQNLDFGSSATALKDGKIDAFFTVAGAPTTNIVDLCTNTKINILGLDDDHVAKLKADYSFYTTYTIEANTYTGVDYDVNAVAVKATLLVADSVDEDVAYTVTKALFECKDDMQHEKASFLDPAYAVEGFDDMPIHPGALKYYQEIGVK